MNQNTTIATPHLREKKIKLVSLLFFVWQHFDRDILRPIFKKMLHHVLLIVTFYHTDTIH